MLLKVHRGFLQASIHQWLLYVAHIFDSEPPKFLFLNMNLDPDTTYLDFSTDLLSRSPDKYDDTFDWANIIWKVEKKTHKKLFWKITT